MTNNEFIEEIDKTAKPFRLDFRSFSEMLDIQQEIFENKEIILFGESTHGTHEFRIAGLYFFRYLVETLGFDTFALEDRMESCVPINKYVETGVGDVEKLIKDLYSVFQTKEILEIINYIKTYNLTGNKKLRFAGFDVNQQNPDTEENYRDKQMAENIFNLRAATPTSKLFVYTHATHSALKPPRDDYEWWKPMGFHLKQYFDEKIYSVACLFGKGSVSATKVDSTEEKNLRRNLDQINVEETPSELLESKLEHARSPNFFIDFATAKNIFRSKSRKLIRVIGWGITDNNYNAWKRDTNLQKDFDGIIFFRNATATEL